MPVTPSTMRKTLTAADTIAKTAGHQAHGVPRCPARCLTSGFRPLAGPAEVTTMAPASWSWHRSGDAVAWCRLGGGGSFGPGQQKDADDSQRQPDGRRHVTAAMAQCLAVDDSPEDDPGEQVTALLDAIAGARTPVLRADCWRTNPITAEARST